MNIQLLRVVFFSLCLTSFFGIQAQSGYYTTGKYLIDGVKIFNKGQLNHEGFTVLEYGQQKVYTPENAIEYGLNKKKVYKAKWVYINGVEKRYFFRELIKGKYTLSLLHLKEDEKRFYLHDSSSNRTVEIPKDRKAIKDFMTAQMKKEKIVHPKMTFTRYGKSNLKRYVNQLNQGNKRVFPRPTIGIHLGLAATTYSPANEYLGEFSAVPFQTEWAGTIGIMANLPINASPVSIHTGLYFKNISQSYRYKYNYKFRGSPVDTDLLIDQSAINIPLLFRYSIYTKTLSPFVQVGPLYSYNFKNKTTQYIYEYPIEGIYTEVANRDFIADHMAGFSMGIGTLLNYGKTLVWSAEVRYSMLNDLGSNEQHLRQSEVSIILGLSI
ncbi:MAG: PorT family protein [Schleiferiaceae bacterium]|nr:PorT family protein [Schleiferiaceae bacterium]